MPSRDPAESPRACVPPDFAEIEARELLSSAIAVFPGQLPMARQAFETLVVTACAGHIAEALEGQEGGGTRRSEMEVVARMLGVIRSFANPWLALRCLPIAFSLPGAESELELAREFGVTKGGVSDICVKLCDYFEIPPGRGMKKPEARESYRQRQKGKRARPHAVPWPFAGMFSAIRAAA